VSTFFKFSFIAEITNCPRRVFILGYVLLVLFGYTTQRDEKIAFQTTDSRPIVIVSPEFEGGRQLYSLVSGKPINNS